MLGATGSVGSVAVQAAKLLGAGRVVAVGRDAGRLAAVERARRRRDRRPSTATIFREPPRRRRRRRAADARPRRCSGGRRSRPRAAVAGPGREDRPPRAVGGAVATLPSGHVRGKQLQILGYSNFAVPVDALATGLRRPGRPRERGPHPARRSRRSPLERVGEAWERQRDRQGGKIVLVVRGAITYSALAVHPVIMPKLGAYTDDVLLAGWLVGEGQQVRRRRLGLRARDGEDDGRGRGRDVGGFVHQLVAGRRPTRCAIGDRDEYEDAVAARETMRGVTTRSSATSATAAGNGRAVAGSSAQARPRCRARRRAGAPLVSPRARALLRELGLHARRRPRDRGLGPRRPHRRPRRRRLGRDARRGARAGAGGRAHRRRARSRCAGGAGRSPRGCSRASRVGAADVGARARRQAARRASRRA